MISNLEKEYQICLENYKKDSSLENKNNLVEILKKIDKEYTNNYLEKLKEYITKLDNINEEKIRLNKITTLMLERQEKRSKILKIIEELSLEIELENIPNLDKIKSFSNKLKIIETILNIVSKLNNSNIDKAKEILNRKEFKIVLLEFSLIENDSNEEIDKYLHTIIEKETNNIVKDSNLKILEYYYDNKKYFNDLTIPNMGLIKEQNNINLDNESFFIK